jgi:hypothetical protein
MTSQTPIIQQTEWYGRQKPCFDRADELVRDKHVTKCIVRDNPSGSVGSKQYACLYGPQGVMECRQSFRAHLLSMGDGHLYELIREDRPVRCYMDIDFERVSSDHERVLEAFLDAMKEFSGFEGAIVTRCVRPSNARKGSFHVVYPDKVFKTAHENGLRLFMTAFRQWCREHKTSSNNDDARQLLLFDAADKFVVDMRVYTKNRLMRLLGNSKRADPDRAVFTGDSSGDGWLIQPPSLVYPDDDSSGISPTDSIITKWFPEGGPMPDKVSAGCEIVKKGNKLTLEAVWAEVKSHDAKVMTNEDFLEYIDAAEVKDRGFDEWFMPMVTSLAATVNRSRLAFWCSTSKVGYLEKYGPLIDGALRYGGGEKWVSGNMALKIFTKKIGEGGNVSAIDFRVGVTTYVNERATTIEATVEGGWIPVDAQHLFKTLTDDCQKDTKKGVQAPRRCSFITGKMGASKTTGLLRFAEHQLRTGKINSVLYVCPRTVLCSQAARSFEDIHVSQMASRFGRMKMKNFIEISRYYSESDADGNVLDFNDLLCATMRGKTKDLKHSRFDCCVINSIRRVPLQSYDMIITDEPVVSVGNFYMDYEAHGGDSEKRDSRCTPLDYSYAYVQLVRRARVTFFVDAAFSPNVIDECTAMYSGATRAPFPQEVMDAEECGAIVLPTSHQRRTAALKSFVINAVDPVDDTPKRLSEIRKYAVFDSTLERPIFEKLVEYLSADSLMAKLARSAYAGKKIIVYCSTAARAAKIMHYLRGNPPSGTVTEVPMPALITSDTFKQDGRAATIRAMEDSQIAIVTSGLGIGSSFPLPDMFDGAFGFYDYKDDTPHMDDLIQLSARVRATTSRTLHYAVTSHTSTPCSNYVEKGVNRDPYIMPRTDTVDDVPRLIAKAYYDRKAFHKAMCTFHKMARERTKEALILGFSHARDATLNYSRPSYRLNTTPPPPDLRNRQRQTRKVSRMDSEVVNDDMCHRCTKRPYKILRGNLKGRDYTEEPIPGSARKVGVMRNPGGMSLVVRDKRRREDEDQHVNRSAPAAAKRARVDSGIEEDEGDGVDFSAYF